VKTIILLDSLNLLYRSYYALPYLKSSHGIPTGALFGFIKTLIQLQELYKEAYFCAITDTKKSLRKEKYSFYKENRETTPYELIEQKKLLSILLSELQIPYIKREGYEADDIIAYIINNHSHEYNFIIVSADKDLRYLALKENIIIYDPLKQCTYDKKYLIETYGEDVTQETIWIYHALKGDQSDNISGVKGIGEKTALEIAKLYTSYNDFIETYKNNLNIKERQKNLIKTQEENFKISYELVKNIEFISKSSIAYFLSKAPLLQVGFAYDLLQQWEFYSLVKNIQKIHKENDGTEKKEKIIKKKEYGDLPFAHDFFTYKLFYKDCLNDLKNKIQNSDFIAFDTETYGGDPQASFAIGYSFCFCEGESWYIDLYNNGEKVFDYNEKLQLLQYIIDYAKMIILHNASFDLHILSNTINLKNIIIFDTMIAAYNIFGEENKIGLKDLSGRLLKRQMISFNDLLEKYHIYKFDCIPLHEAAQYAAADAHQTFLLYHYFLKNYLHDESFKYLYDIEMPLVYVLHTIEKNGFTCNGTILDEQKIILENDLKTIKYSIDSEVKKIYSDNNLIFDNNFNPLSHKQVNILLFEIMKLPGSYKTQQTKKYSTNQKALTSLIHKNHLIKLILDYRTLSSILSRCTVGLKKYIKDDGKIHSTFQQVFVSTGRLSSVNPNLQNIPKAEKSYNYSIRSAFTSSSQNNILISFDFSQIELRILAHISQDDVLVESFKNNLDIHLITAASLFEKPIHEISKEEREIGKRINFSIVYGTRAFGLAKDLGIQTSQAQKYLDLFWQKYTRLKAWQNEIIKKTEIDGFVETLYKRKRFLSDITSNIISKRKHAERVAINTIIQGSAAELIKKSILDMSAFLKNYIDASIVMHIHDELILEVPCKHEEEIIKKGTEILQNCITLSVPLVVNSFSGNNWEQL
jgi:DNA polymerase-1